MEAFLERLRTGLGTHAPVLNTYGLDSEADFAQLHDDDVAAEEVWALLEANGCKRLQARAILKGMGLDPDLLEAPGATSIGVVVAGAAFGTGPALCWLCSPLGWRGTNAWPELTFSP